MRQTLFYISLDAPFSVLTQGTEQAPILHIGIGLLLLALFALYSVWFFRTGKQQMKEKNLAATPKKKGRSEPSEVGIQPIISVAVQLLLVGFAAYFFVPKEMFQVVANSADPTSAKTVLEPSRAFPVFGYGTMLLIAFVAGASWAGKRADQVGINRETVWDAAICILISGVVGSRIFYLVQKREMVFANVESTQDFLIRIVKLNDGGLVFYGGMILATISYFAFCHLRKVRPLLLADVVTPSIFLGIGFGRIGCLLNGCCFGDRCELPWAISFPPGSVPYSALTQLGFLAPDATASLPLHPTQIYSAIGGMIFAYLTATVFQYRKRVGEVFAVGAILYPINRFLVEFVRGDEFTQLDTGLTISQLVSIGILCSGIIYLIYLEFFDNSELQTTP